MWSEAVLRTLLILVILAVAVGVSILLSFIGHTFGILWLMVTIAVLVFLLVLFVTWTEWN
jgi:hypothetical protein